MHPQLSEELRPECAHLIKALRQCHEENPKAKLMGACNEINSALDKCLKEAREAQRQKNLAKARKRKEALRKQREHQQ
ncbi:hypothetical protein PTSG_05061 [Salpingoeca rosetta]|uniref:COX assembly mitochondrial protein n=1 Tax=Salpingoeca rosetta (strain ATCC 50818 / BSB-021) TaxID=946362 RepID=F2U9E6_SALR5|nr:uncharacterized protein PTSG_05061 [Salpingoeca rosetta]EGD73349.1 hypothetical protein PTSG_05061 [Salpingoeca rosetta]|eukprot:XP_004994379.1 hypothetical protein PTSG_05061 [Salpingoeca rosetta]